MRQELNDTNHITSESYPKVLNNPCDDIPYSLYFNQEVSALLCITISVSPRSVIGLFGSVND